MILNVSRRTDIPAFYSEWFYNRLQEGFCYTQNPMNPKQINKINLTPDVVDAIIFWTKNPTPMLPRLDEIKGFPYYFQYTLTSYGKDIESRLPRKKYLVKTFQDLSKKLGKERVIWRYDPILLNKHYTIDYHIKYFEVLAKNLHDYTNKIMISFIDFYKKIARQWQSLGLYELSLEEKNILAKAFSDIAHAYDLCIETCCEEIDLERYHIKHGHCIDEHLLEKLIGCSLHFERDKYQRPFCGCIQSIDIGIYDTCLNACQYCYACTNEKTILENKKIHNPHNPLLIGTVPDGVNVIDKAQYSFKNRQNSFAIL